MNRLTLSALALLLAGSAFGGRNLGFGIEAFNKALPSRGTNAVSAVFSPFAFELDAVTMADAFEPITKAHIVETVGVLTDLANTYVPLQNHLRTDSATNGLSFLTARAFCVPSYRKVSAPYHREIQDVFAAEICPAFPKEGAENWFRARMDGEMEDFEIPASVAKLERNDFYDLVSVRTSWLEPFPLANTRKVGFWTELNRVKVPVDCLCDIRRVDICEKPSYTICRLPLRDEAQLFLLRPKDNTTVDEVRLQVAGDTIDDLVTLMDSITELNVFHGPALVSIPRFDITTHLDLLPAMAHFKFPSKGFIRLDGMLPAQDFVQFCRFRLDESGLSEPVQEKPVAEQIPANAAQRKFVLNRPFVFFVYHKPTHAILVAGEYTGR